MSSSGPKRHLVKSSIQFEFDEQILQVSLVPNSSSRVMVVTTNGLYVYSCEGKRKKLIMTNRTTLSKVVQDGAEAGGGGGGLRRASTALP